MQLRSLLIGIVAGALLAHADPAVAQDPDSLPTPSDDDRIDDEYEDDEEGDPRLRRALQAYLAELAAMTPHEIVGDTTAPGVQAGGTEIRVRVPGTETLVREEPDDPRDAPAPEIYGEETCPSGNVRGQFEPVQGVWQDDPTFADKPGKRIVRLSPVLWRAELPMVTERRTMLFGIERAPGAEPRRDEIFIAGEATGTGRIPVKFRFTLKQPGRTVVVHETEILGEIPIGEPCRPDAVLPFEVSLDVSEGVPSPPGNAFLFQDGEYLLEAELVREDGRGTGLKVGVLGNSVTTQSPALAFRVVAIMGSALEESRLAHLQEIAEQLARTSADQIPDLYPVANRRLETKVFPPKDRTDLLQRFARPGRKPKVTDLVERFGPDVMESYLNDALREELLRELGLGGLMNGWDRVIVLVADGDFRLLWQGSLDLELDASGFTASRKISFLNAEVSGDRDWGGVAHEVVHNSPWVFAGDEMIAECDLDYHNKSGLDAHGHQLALAGDPTSIRRDNSHGVMSGSFPSPWITQCTYRHLIEYLSAGVPDPPILVVQGFVARHDGRADGIFLPFYHLDGFEDLPVGGTGTWSVVLRDADGDVLARHAWDPIWRIPHVPGERDLTAFVFRVLRPQGLARVDLEGPDGLADSVLLSATEPVVSIVSPAEGAAVALEDGAARVEWRGSDADGDPVLFTVLYSSDGGRRWIDVVVETEEVSTRIPIDPDAPADAHRILVRATDGGRSADASVAFRVGE